MQTLKCKYAKIKKMSAQVIGGWRQRALLAIVVSCEWVAFCFSIYSNTFIINFTNSIRRLFNWSNALAERLQLNDHNCYLIEGVRYFDF